jgi:hypothetical protein
LAKTVNSIIACFDTTFSKTSLIIVSLGSYEELERMVKTMIEDIGRMNKVLELKKNVTKLKKRI